MWRAMASYQEPLGESVLTQLLEATSLDELICALHRTMQMGESDWWMVELEEITKPLTLEVWAKLIEGSRHNARFSAQVHNDLVVVHRTLVEE